MVIPLKFQPDHVQDLAAQLLEKILDNEELVVVGKPGTHHLDLVEMTLHNYYAKEIRKTNDIKLRIQYIDMGETYADILLDGLTKVLDLTKANGIEGYKVISVIYRCTAKNVNDIKFTKHPDMKVIYVTNNYQVFNDLPRFKVDNFEMICTNPKFLDAKDVPEDE